MEFATPEDKRTPGQTLLAYQVIRTVTVSDAEIDRVISSADKAAKQQIHGSISQVEQERPAPIPIAMGVTL